MRHSERKFTLGVTPEPQCTAQQCGHQSYLTGVIIYNERPYFVKVPRKPDGSIDWCIDCMIQMTIRCPVCAKPIFVNDVVTFYEPTDHIAPQGAIIYQEQPLRIVQCAFCGCAHAPLGTEPFGFWVPHNNTSGKVRIARSPHELYDQHNYPLVSEVDMTHYINFVTDGPE